MSKKGMCFECVGGWGGVYSILSIKNNVRFYAQPGLSAQSTGPESMRNHTRSLCVCSWLTKQVSCVSLCSLCDLAVHQQGSYTGNLHIYIKLSVTELHCG